MQALKQNKFMMCKQIVPEKRWRQFFSEPSKWWDHRFDKRTAKYPDFKHKETDVALWINGRSTPDWVKAKVVSLLPGTVQRSVFSWNTMLTRFMKFGQHRQVLERWEEMQKEDIYPDSFTYVQVLKACTGLLELEIGRRIHRDVMESGSKSDIFVCNSLIDMYSKCGSLEDACKVFKNMPIPDVVCWSTMIMGYVKCGQGSKALQLFFQMQREDVQPDIITFVNVLSACTSSAALEEGRHIHAHVIRYGFEYDIFVGSCLVDMYNKCGSIEDAIEVFQTMSTRNVVSWSSMIVGYTDCNQGEKAVSLFSQMQLERVNPDRVTFMAVLNACASTEALEEGRCVHAQVIEKRYVSDVFVGSSLIDMYSKCGSLEDATQVFHSMPDCNTVSWNAMIGACVKNSQEEKALVLFQQMQREKVESDNTTYVYVLNACARLLELDFGTYTHMLISRSKYKSDFFVGSCLCEMYAHCGSIVDACRVFNNMPTQDLVSWSAILLGHSKLGEEKSALKLFKLMQQAGVAGDAVTFVSVLHVCASLAAIKEGRYVHLKVIQYGCESDVLVASSLIEMYSKCGRIDEAERVFNSMPILTLTAWNAMLDGYGIHGLGKQALRLCDEMGKQVQMDSATFVTLLSACSHTGFVDEGHCYFELMSPVFDVATTVGHYSCMVDLLGRGGYLDEAEDMINRMAHQPEIPIWMALLGACRVHGNVEMGERIALQVLELDPHNASCYVLLSNVYAAAGNWESRIKVQKLRKERHLHKEAGCTWIEVNGEVHRFFVADTEHPRIIEIQEELRKLSLQMKKAGYVPDKRFEIRDREEGGHSSCQHSERLAIAFGLISTPSGSQLHIFKNLRVCEDCHTASKYISRIAGRSLVVRDANRFHHFVDGICSCGDYW
ncbi:hypothetical protein O6H91_06G004500 [Diphasiastrum complanatum]|uniref:Uncharacterized protein n=2 Tax=Diphasiastrum complanatum TaxID=34168 RepID=A0ACC2DAA0_DIPCM|nr:hypothetical protein O6H91_06G004500 [Diphasiastrum complanatum]